MKKKTKFTYSGPVKCFDDVVLSKWDCVTYAKSRKQALNNLSYRYKKDNGYTINTKINLNDKYLSEDDDYIYYDDAMKKMIAENNAKRKEVI